MTVRAEAAPRPTRVDATQVLPRRRRLWPWIVALAVVAALVAGGAAVWATRDSGGGSTTDLARFVVRIENVLAQSASGRQEISAALTDGLNCRISNARAAQRIESVAENRQSILQQLYSLNAPTAGTDRMLILLQQALQHSIEADRHYKLWFRSTTSCPLPQNPEFDLATASDQKATTAKELFVARFDRLATSLHRRAWSAGQF